MKEQLKKAKLELQKAERNGDLARAGELAYGIIPTLERQLPKEFVPPFIACFATQGEIFIKLLNFYFYFLHAQ